LNFAAAGSSQISGNIAANTGGIKVIPYDMTRAWVQNGVMSQSHAVQKSDLAPYITGRWLAFNLRHFPKPDKPAPCGTYEAISASMPNEDASHKMRKNMCLMCLVGAAIVTQEPQWARASTQPVPNRVSTAPIILLTNICN